MKQFVFIILALLVFSCQNSVCDCVEAGNKANEISASFFDREFSEAGKDSLDRAIEKRDEICKPFQNMSVEELQEASSQCDNLIIEVD